jgi:5-methylcytosine-specific restriction endonuclease McrA
MISVGVIICIARNVSGVRALTKEHWRLIDMDSITEKKCTKCGEYKDKSEFSKHKLQKDGLQTQCKECRRILDHNYRTTHLEQNRKRSHKYYDAHPEIQLNSNKKWRQANKEKVREIGRNYYKKHDAVREYKRLWIKEHPEINAANSRNRRARVKGNGGEIQSNEWIRLKTFYNNTCLCCYRQEPEIKLTLDHVVPIALGGRNTIDNSQPLCQTCNSRKGKRTIDYRKL